MNTSVSTQLLFDDPIDQAPSHEPLGEGAVLLREFARSIDLELLRAIDTVAASAPFRNMTTPGGFVMSVAMTNCGPLGWITDRRGYRYDDRDPESGRPWPAMPAIFLDLAKGAASEAGFGEFEPDACLINRYEPGSRLSLHQDRNERDFTAPIVSVSLGLPATFLFGGEKRGDRARRVRVHHGDVAVWGGPSRLAYHGISPLRPGHHSATGPCRFNLTLRRAR